LAAGFIDHDSAGLTADGLAELGASREFVRSDRSAQRVEGD